MDDIDKDRIGQARVEGGRIAEDLEAFMKEFGELPRVVSECVGLAMYALARFETDPDGTVDRLTKLAEKSPRRNRKPDGKVTVLWAPIQEAWAAIENMSGQWQGDPHA